MLEHKFYRFAVKILHIFKFLNKILFKQYFCIYIHFQMTNKKYKFIILSFIMKIYIRKTKFKLIRL